MDEINELKNAIGEYQKAASAAIAGTGKGIAELTARLDEIEKKSQRPPAYGVGWGGGEGEEVKAFESYLRKGEAAGELKAMSIGSDPDGGYSVVSPLAASMTRRIFELSPVRQVARVVEVRTDAFEELVDNGEPAANWVGEKSARPETDGPQIGKLRIPVCEIYSAPKVTQNLLEDSAFDVGAWLVEKIADKFARAEAAGFITGDGITQPRGILTYPVAATDDATRAWGTLQYTPSGAAGAFAASNPSDALLDMVYKLKSAYRPRATWLMNRDTARRIRQFKDGQGNYLWQAGATAGQPDSLMGFPVLLAEDMPAIAANSLSIAFGDLSTGYTIADRVGVSVLRDPFSVKPHVQFYTRKRVGGGLSNSEAIKLMKFAAT